MSSLFIMRGLPGSGKSFLAQKLCELNNGAICSTDNYFMNDGKYLFDRTKLGIYHRLNQKSAGDLLEENISVFVDNTNITWKEVKTYVDIGVKYKSSIYVVEAATPWAKNPEECFKRNSHGVPLETITRMYTNFSSKESIIENMKENVYFQGYLTIGCD